MAEEPKILEETYVHIDNGGISFSVNSYGVLTIKSSRYESSAEISVFLGDYSNPDVPKDLVDLGQTLIKAAQKFKDLKNES